MARYGTFKWGTRKWGATVDPTDNLLWSFLVAWDGTYTGQNEGSRMYDFKLSRGRDVYITENGFEPYSPGVVTAVFDNDDGRYDPWNASSPLYPNVRPGKFVRCLVKNGNTGTNYPLMRGLIADIQPYNKGKQRFVRIVVKDGLEALAKQSVTVGMVEDNQFGLCIKKTLDECSLNTTEWPYSLNNVGNTIPFFWASKTPALHVIHELEASELGTFRQRAGGTFFWSARTTGVTSTTGISEDEILTDIIIPQPWESLINEAKINLNALSSHNITDVLWDIENPPILIPDGTPFTAEVSFMHPTKNIPVVADNVEPLTYYSINNDPLVDVGSTFVPVITLENIGKTGDLTIINTSGAGDAYLWLFHVAGDAVYADYKSSKTAQDLVSQAAYGKRTMTIDTPWMQRETIAPLRASSIVANLADPIPMPTIKIENRAALQFGLDLFEHGIHLQLPTFGLDDTYRIGKIEHEWRRESGQSVITTYKLEPVLTFA